MKITSIILLLFFSSILPGQADETIQVVVPDFDTTTIEFGYYEAPYLHRSVALDTSREGYVSYMAGTLLSFSGLVRESAAIMDQEMAAKGMDTARYKRFKNEFHPVAAVPSLLTKAEDHEVFIINEAHHEPRHRAFSRSLLRGLYERGYRHLGMETLAHGYRNVDSLLKAGDPLDLNDGFYTRDPQFAAMVMEAHKIGFSVFGYEASGTGSPRLRELGQMRNIMRYRAKHPEGKLFLHVGYSHAREGELGGRWDKAMAQRLADTTGLDPLTVDQTFFREMSAREKERYEYRDFPVDEPSVFVNDDNEPFNYDNDVRWFDEYVFHPRTTYRDERPDYVFASGQRRVLVDLTSLPGTGPYLLHAYAVTDDPRHAVPHDVIERKLDEPVSLALPPGDFKVIVQLTDGRQYLGEFTVMR